MKYIIYGIIILVLVAASGFVIQDYSHKKQIAQCNMQIATLTAQRDSCYASKENITIDTLRLEVPQYIVRTELMPVDSFLIYSVLRDEYGEEVPTQTLIRAYKDTLTNKDFKLPYELTVNGYLESVTFGNYTILRKEKTIEHIVKVPVNVVREVEKSHLYFYFMLGSSFGVSSDYSYEGGIDITFKNKFGLLMGYQRFNSGNIFKIGAKIKII